MDDNPRPSKRQRMSPSSTSETELTPLPHSALLLSLPSLLLHPPNHRNHTRSLWLSLFALRKCLTLPNLEPYEECRALTEVAEIGFNIGLAYSGIESEVEKSITKAVGFYCISILRLEINKHIGFIVAPYSKGIFVLLNPRQTFDVRNISILL